MSNQVTLTLTMAGSGSGTVVRDPAGTPTGATTFRYARGGMVTLTAAPADGIFAGWRVDGTVTGQINPLHLAMDAAHSVVAEFSADPPPTFSDLGEATPEEAAAITELVQQGVIQGYGDGTVGPDDPTLRAQMAAMIARAMGWDAEDHGNSFPDQCDPPGPYDPNSNYVDPDLWRNVGTLAFYGISHSYEDGTFGPRNTVAYAQAISLITRAMVTKGYWQNQPDDPDKYPNVTDPTHRADIATYTYYAGPLPGTATTSQDLPN